MKPITNRGTVISAFEELSSVWFHSRSLAVLAKVKSESKAAVAALLIASLK
jgi:hypothetical protein